MWTYVRTRWTSALSENATALCTYQKPLKFVAIKFANLRRCSAVHVLRRLLLQDIERIQPGNGRWPMQSWIHTKNSRYDEDSIVTTDSFIAVPKSGMLHPGAAGPAASVRR